MDTTLNQILISRRRFEMGGTRFNARGVDEEGNAGNFVETETIVETGSLIISFVQIRGSVPFLWNQKTKN